MEAEKRIRAMKERVRCMIHHLPFQMPRLLIASLTFFVNSRLTMMPSHQHKHDISPTEQINGRRLDYKKEASLCFGAYCHIPNGSDNTLAARTVGCIALYPLGNLQGSWRFYCISTKACRNADRWQESPRLLTT